MVGRRSLHQVRWRRWPVARSRRGARSPVFSAGRRLDAILFLFLGLHVTLFARRGAEELLGLPLSQTALRLLLRLLPFGSRGVGISAAAAATTAAILLVECELVIPFC